MINIIYSPVMEYDDAVASGFDSARKKKLSSEGLSRQKKNEMFTSGFLIEKIRPEGTNVYYKAGGRPEFTKYFDSVTLSTHSSYRSFNVSHSGGLVFLAYSDQNDVGVDFEPGDREISDRIKKRLCSDTEKSIYEVLDTEEKKHEFLLKLFTRKEALSKLFGVGIALDFSRIEDKGVLNDWYKNDFIAKVEIPEDILGKNRLKTYVIRTLFIEGGYLSVAYEYNQVKLRDRYELNISKV